MRAVLLKKYGPPEMLELRDVPKPVPKAGEVLIRVVNTTVTAGDCELRTMQFPLFLRIPLRIYFSLTKKNGIIPGQEVSGVIEATGRKVTRFGEGQPVVAGTMLHLGGYAEYVCLPQDCPILPKPDRMTFGESATLITGGLNAIHFIRKANIRAGQSVLINGSGGSIGTYFLQIAKALGAEVTAVDSNHKLDMLTSIGADHVIDYKREDFTKRNRFWDVILDIVGNTDFHRTLACVNSGGCYILGNPRFSAMLRAIRANRRSGKRVTFEFAGYTAEDQAELMKYVENGVVRPVIDQEFLLHEMAAAHHYVGAGHKRGNVIVKVAAVPM